jgi:hypothetical protein
MHIDELRQETENKPLQSYLAHIEKIRRRLESLRDTNTNADQDK